MLGITDLYFKRQKRLRGEYPDVYQYDELSQALKVQIVHVWEESIDKGSSSHVYLENCYKILCKELCVFKLNENDRYERSYFKRISNSFLNEEDSEISLSIVELMMVFISLYSKKHNLKDIFLESLKKLINVFVSMELVISLKTQRL